MLYSYSLLKDRRLALVCVTQNQEWTE
jgi:hypothetical protein